jgi:hypothetical protein
MPIPLGVLAVAGAGAAGGGGSFDLLETTLISTNTASITFSSLGSYSNYKHLQIRATTRSATGDSTGITFNSDTGNNYARHALYGDGDGVYNSTQTSAANIRLLQQPVISTGVANAFGGMVLDILDFSNSSKNTTIRAFYGKNDGSFDDYIMLTSGFWNNTAAVTSITLTSITSGNYVAGSRFSLYGIK